MTYDLAVWEGERPPSDEAAHALYMRLSDPFPQGPVGAVTDVINDFAIAVGERFEIEGVQECGSFAYIMGIRATGGDVDPIALLAVEHGLVCYDPQAMSLLP